MNNLYIGLVHYPVYNKNNNIVCTSITNLDIHDIARTSRTYNVKKFFIINPQPSQKKIFERLKRFWHTDVAKEYNVCRFNAFDTIKYVDSIEEAKKIIQNKTDFKPLVFTTSANTKPKSISYKKGSKLIENHGAALILFGTAYGLAREVIKNSNYNIEKIEGVNGYNHLSVRSAIAITLDRLIADYK